MQPIRTKKQENKEAKQEGPRKFLVQPRKDKRDWLGWGSCIAKENSELMAQLTTF